MKRGFHHPGRGCLAACLAALLLPLGPAPRAEPELLHGVTKLITGGRTYVYISDMARYFGFNAQVLRDGRFVLLSPWTRIMLEPESRKLYYNRQLVWMHEPSRRLRRRWCITEDDITKLLAPLLMKNDYLKTCGYTTVVLDPGHGGMDPGGTSALGDEEKHVVLDIVRRVRARLVVEGVQVVLTRDADVALELPIRSHKARRCKADLYVSVHLNSSGNPLTAGQETYVLTAAGYPSTNESTPGTPNLTPFRGLQFNGANVILGFYLQQALVKRLGGPDRGLRRARFAVLKDAPCPAALVECGFLTNERENLVFSTTRHRDLVATALAEGILNYLASVKRARVINP